MCDLFAFLLLYTLHFLCKPWIGCQKNTAIDGGCAEAHGNVVPLQSALQSMSIDRKRVVSIWVCLKIGYIPNYSHLIGIMIINHWV